MSDLPWEKARTRIDIDDPTMVVDLQRCIGCHACSVACKVQHQVPLGEFRMRVRWLQHPTANTLTFFPVFDDATCDLGTERRQSGMHPACVAACPTDALRLTAATNAAAGATPLQHPETKRGVLYRGHEPWHDEKLNRGAALDPSDDDIIYEQGYRK